MKEIILKIKEGVINGKIAEVTSFVEDAILQGIDPDTVMNDGLITAMTEVGDRFERGDFFVPEMLVAAKAMESGLGYIKPMLERGDFQPAGKAIVGTVKGDLHDIGKNLVAMMLRGGGFDVIDLGVDVSAEDFINAASEQHPDLIGMSALLTTTMTQMSETIKRIKEVNDLANVKIIVGGAPVTQDFANEIGADGFAQDAHAAVNLARSLL